VYTRWTRWLEDNEVVRNTAAMSAGGGVRLLFQALYFILIARCLGPGQYGAFVGAVSLVAVLSPFAIWGADGILVRDVARHRDRFAECWGNAICTAAVFGALLVGVVLVLSSYIFSGKAPLVLVLLVAISDLLFSGIVTLASHAFTAFEMLGRTAQIGIILTGSRAICAVVMYFFLSCSSATSWAVLYLGSTVIAAFYSYVAVSRKLGRPRWRWGLKRYHVKEGFFFSLSLSSQSIYNNIDKTMLVRLATLEAAGIYATAYRIIDLALQPVSSLLYATYARFFQHGSRGIANSARYARRLMPFAAGYGLLAGIFLFLCAPLLPTVVGARYSGAQSVLRWLSPLIFIRTIHYLLSNSLTGADLQRLRSILQLSVAAFNVLINLWLIPLYSWRGAAWGSLASDTLLGISVAVAILLLKDTVKIQTDTASTGGTLRVVPEPTP